MAKKKKGKRNRQPVAPPVHSAPGTVHHTGPSQRPPDVPSSSRPETSGPPGVPVEPAPRRTDGDAGRPRQRRQTPAQIRSARRARTRKRTYLILGTVVVLIIGAIVMQRITSGRSSAEFEALGKSAGCGKVRDTGGSGAMEHLQTGESTKYDTTPPTHGKHSPSTLPAGVYDEPLSDEPTQVNTIYRAVHSLEHGAIIVWHDGLTKQQKELLVDEYDGEDKILVVEYPQLKGDTHVALTAWGKLAECERPSTKYIDAFIERYREARSAPEPNAAL